MATGLTTSQSASQSATASPQTATSTAGAGSQSGSVQPGTAADLLRNSQGIQLVNTQPDVVTLGASTGQTTAPPHSSPVKHHVNAGLVGLAALLIVVAVVLFWTAERSVKSTT